MKWVVSSTVTPCAPQRLQRLPEIAPGARVEPGAGLVEQQEARLVEERLGDLRPPAQPPGELRRPLARALGQAEALETGGDPPGEVPAAEAVEMPLMDEVLADGELEIEAGALEDDAEPAADLPRLRGEVGAEDVDRAALRAGQGREDAEQGRLAAAVGPEEAEDLPRRHLEVDPRERRRHLDRPAAATLGGIGEPHAARLRRPPCFRIDCPGTCL